VTVPAPWLEIPYRRCVEALEAGRLAHALIISGPPGWGQADLARALALRLLDRSDSPANVDMQQLAHPDLRWLVPEGKGEQIRIDAVRALGAFANQTPQIAARKVAVLNPADALNEHAANALLKTLEEPPGGTYLLLVTESLADLIPTIRSRCQRIDIVPFPAAEVVTWLKGSVPGFDAAAVETVAFDLGYAPQRVMAALAEGARSLGDIFVAAFEGRSSAVALAERMPAVSLDDFVTRSMRHLAVAVAARQGGRSSASRSPMQLAGVPEQALFAFWDEHLEARRLCRGTGNPNPRLLAENLLLGWRTLGRLDARRSA
jgi:DNA polymerase-3 subunit delta'